jgi:EpsI family protein
LNVAAFNWPARRYRWDAIALGMSMLATALAAVWVRPVAIAVERPPLAQLVPNSFGDWTALPDAGVRVVDPSVSPPNETNTDQPYSDVLMRAYRNSKGDVVMLALAYGAQQRQEVKIHRPELCYVAQGFEILKRSPASFAPHGEGAASGARLLVRRPEGVEAVSYWIRIGRIYSTSGWQTRYYLFKEALRGRVVDGILVRASQVFADPQTVSAGRYEVQESFLAELLDAWPSAWRDMLVDR